MALDVASMLIGMCHLAVSWAHFGMSSGRTWIKAKHAKKKADEGEGGGGWFGSFSLTRAKSSLTSMLPYALTGAGEEAGNFAEQSAKFRELIQREADFEAVESLAWVGATVDLTLSAWSFSLTEVDPATRHSAQILRMGFTKSTVQFGQRPAAEAMHVMCQLGELSMDMIRHDGVIAQVLTPMASKELTTHDAGAGDENIGLELFFETKPLCATGVAPDLALRLAVRPTELYVTAPGIKRVTGFLDTSDLETTTIETAVADTAGVVSTQTATGLEYLNEQRSVMDIDIVVEAPVVLLPAKDDADSSTHMIVMDLGVIKLKSILDPSAGESTPPVHSMSGIGAAALGASQSHLTVLSGSPMKGAAFGSMVFNTGQSVSAATVVSTAPDYDTAGETASSDEDSDAFYDAEEELDDDRTDVYAAEVDVDNDLSEKDRLEEMRRLAYDVYSLELNRIQIVLSHRSENWRDALHTKSSPMHLLDQMDVAVEAKKCLQENDSELAQFKVSGNLPSFSVLLTSLQICRLVQFGDTIAKEFAPDSNEKVVSIARAVPAAGQVSDPRPAGDVAPSVRGSVLAEQQGAERRAKRAAQRAARALYRIADFDMTVEKVEVKLSYETVTTPMSVPVAKFALGDMRIEGRLRKWDTELDFGIRSLGVTAYTKQSAPVRLLDARGALGSSADFVSLVVKMCDSGSPLFAAEFSSTKQAVNADIQRFVMIVDQDALCGSIHAVKRIMDQMDAEAKGARADAVSTSAIEGAPEDAGTQDPEANTRANAVDSDFNAAPQTVVDVDFALKFDTMACILQASNGPLLTLSMSKMAVKGKMAPKSLEVVVDVESIDLGDATAAKGEHSKIIYRAAADEPLLHLTFEQQTDATTGRQSGYLGVVLTELRVVFLMAHVTKVTEFAKPITKAATVLELKADEADSNAATAAIVEDVANSVASTPMVSPIPMRALGSVVSEQGSRRSASFSSWKATTSFGRADGIKTDTIASLTKSFGQPLPTTDTPNDPPLALTLDISIAAPLIVVPTHVTSADGLAVRLGSISIKNTLNQTDTMLQDSISITLRDVYVAKAELDTAVFLVNPTRKFLWIELGETTVQRCVQYVPSQMWTPDAPISLEVDASIDAIRASIYKNDLKFVTTVLDMNLGSAGAANDDDDFNTSPEPQSVAVKASSTDPKVSLCAKANTNGMKAKFTLDRVVCALSNEPLVGKTDPAGVAEFSMNSIVVTHIADIRGDPFQTASATKGLCCANTAVEIHKICMLDTRSAQQDPGVVLGPGDGVRGQAQLELAHIQWSTAVQFVGVPEPADTSDAQEPNTEPLPSGAAMDPDVLTAFGSLFGPVVGVYPGVAADGVRTATVAFEDPEAAKRLLYHMHQRPEEYASLFSHWNWDPEASHTDTQVTFRSLELVLALDLWLEIAEFAKAGDDGAAAAETAAAAAPVALPPVPSTVESAPVAHARPDSCMPSASIKWDLQQQRLVLVEALPNKAVNEIGLAVACSGEMTSVGQNTDITVRVFGFMNGAIDGSQHTILPNFEAWVTTEGVNKDMKVTVNVGEIMMTVSLDDINLLTGLGTTVSQWEGLKEDVVMRGWRPVPAQVAALRYLEHQTDTDDGFVAREQAVVTMPLVNVILVDSSTRQREPLLLLSSRIDVEAGSWSSDLRVATTLTTAISAFDSQSSSWHPLVIAGPEKNDSVAPIVFNFELRSNEPDWIPNHQAPDDAGVRCVNSSKGSADAMLDGKPTTFWDAGSSGPNQAVFDFGTPVKISGMRYCCVNKGKYAPRVCELFVGAIGATYHTDVKWIPLQKFMGSNPDNTQGASVDLRYTTAPFSVRSRYLKWVIKDRFARGGARIKSVEFEVCSEGVLMGLTCANSIEMTLPSATLWSIQRAFASDAKAQGEARKPTRPTTGTLHTITNRTDRTVAFIGSMATDVVRAHQQTQINLSEMSSDQERRTPLRCVSDQVRVAQGSFPALDCIIGGEENDPAITVEVDGWAPFELSGLNQVPSLQTITMAKRSMPYDARVAVSIATVDGSKQIAISSPCLFQNMTDQNLELSSTISSAIATKDIELQAGAEGSFPIGLMDNIVDEDRIPLYRFLNTQTAMHFYSTDALDLLFLEGRRWEEEGILGYIFPTIGEFVRAEPVVEPVELWVAIPSSSRAVSRMTVLTVRRAECGPSESRITRMAKENMRLAGYVYPHTACQSRAEDLDLVYESCSNEDEDSVFASGPVGKKETEELTAAFGVVKAQGLVRVRPGADSGHQWSFAQTYWRELPSDPCVSLLSSTSDTEGVADFVCAVRNNSSTGRWMISPLLGLRNRLPYPVFCGLTCKEGEVPQTVHAVQPHEAVSLAMPPGFSLKAGGKLFLRSSLVSSDGAAVAEEHWGQPTCVATLGGDEPLGRADEAHVISFVQRNVEYSVQLQINRTLEPSGDYLGVLDLSSPCVVYNETELELDVFMADEKAGIVGSYSLWRPPTAGFSDPGLLSPPGCDLESVVLVMNGIASANGPLYRVDGIQTVELTTKLFHGNEHSSLMVDLLQRKATSERSKTRALNSSQNRDSLVLTTAWYFESAKWLCRRVTIRAAFVLRNDLAVGLRLVRRPVGDEHGFTMQHQGTGRYLGTAVLEKGKGAVVASMANESEGRWWVYDHRPSTSFAGGKDAALLSANRPAVTYGAPVRLIHQPRRKRLQLGAKPERRQSKDGTVQLPELFCQDIEPAEPGHEDWWMFEPVFGVLESALGQPVRQNDQVRLVHISTGRSIDLGGGSEAVDTTSDGSTGGCWTVKCTGDFLLCADRSSADCGEWVSDETTEHHSCLIAPGKSEPINNVNDPRVQWCLETGQGERSSPFNPASSNELEVRLTTKRDGFLPVRVSLSRKAKTTLMLVSGPARHPLYRLENRCLEHTLYLSQRSAHTSELVCLAPGQMLPWCPYDACEPDIFLKILVDTGKGLISVPEFLNLSELNTHCFELNTENQREQLHTVSYTEDVTGTHVLVFCSSVATARAAVGLAPKIAAESLVQTISVSVPSIGVSMVESIVKPGSTHGARPHELLYMRVSKVSVTLETTSKRQKTSLVVGDFQIDDCNRTTSLPVLLHCPAKGEGVPFMRMTVVVLTAQVGSYPIRDMYEYIGFSLQEMDLRADKGSLPAILAFAENATFCNPASAAPAESVEETVLVKQEAMTFAELAIGSIKLKLTVAGSSDDGNPIMLFVPDLRDFSIHLASVELKSQNITVQDLTEKLVGLYTTRVLNYLVKFGILKGILSLGFLGDTTKMLDTFGSGLKQALYDPAKMVLKGDGNFGMAFGKGALGLGRALAGGVTGLAANVTQRSGSIIAGLTFDGEFQRRRQSAQAHARTSAVGGVTTGAVQLGRGLLDGLSGLVLDPLAGAKKGGVVGLLKGIGTGMAGLVAKPLVGTVDLVANSMAGVESLVGPAVAEQRRARLVRHVPPNRAIVPYSMVASSGAEILSLSNQRSLLQDYISHVDSQSSKKTKSYILVLQTRVIVVEVSKLKLERKSVTPVADITRHAVCETGVQLDLKDGSTQTLACAATDAEALRILVGTVWKGPEAVAQAGRKTSSYTGAPQRRTPSHFDPEGEFDGLAVEGMAKQDLVVAERQRFMMGIGWSADMLSSGGRWIVTGSNTGYREQKLIKPPPGSRWVGDWALDKVEGANEGWLYALDWPNAFSVNKVAMDCVRKRVWRRAVEETFDVRAIGRHCARVVYSGRAASTGLSGAGVAEAASPEHQADVENAAAADREANAASKAPFCDFWRGCKLRITGTRVVKGSCLYKIRVVGPDGSTYAVERRYTKFAALHSALAKCRYSRAPVALPKKTLFRSTSKGHIAIEERTKAFQSLLTESVTLDADEQGPLRRFLTDRTGKEEEMVAAQLAHPGIDLETLSADEHNREKTRRPLMRSTTPSPSSADGQPGCFGTP